MNNAIYDDSNALANVMSAAVQELIRQARNVGLTWTLRLATVVTNAPDSMTAIYDGDTVPISMINMTGATLEPEERVYGLIIPPAGNFIAGRVVRVGPIGRVDSSTYNANDNTNEIIVLTTGTLTFLAGRTYRIQFQLSTATAGPGTNQTIIRIREGSTVFDTELGHLIFINTVGFGQETRHGAVYVSFGKTVSTKLCLTQQAQLSISTSAIASTTNVFYLEAEEVGPMVNYPNAIVVNA